MEAYALLCIRSPAGRGHSAELAGLVLEPVGSGCSAPRAAVIPIGSWHLKKDVRVTRTWEQKRVGNLRRSMAWLER